MALVVEHVAEPTPDDRAKILRGLVAHNDAAFGPSNIEQLAVLLKTQAGETVGGLWGRTTYGWLFVELLFVPEDARGQGLGAALIMRAEEIARGRGCANAWIDCFGEENRRFYEAQGFELFGSIAQPPGNERFFLQKAL